MMCTKISVVFCPLVRFSVAVSSVSFLYGNDCTCRFPHTLSIRKITASQLSGHHKSWQNAIESSSFLMFCAKYLCFRDGKIAGNAKKWPVSPPILHQSYTNPTPNDVILHPILHPKSIAYKGVFVKGCRKCMFFFRNFFCGEVCLRAMDDDERHREHRTQHCHSRQFSCGTASGNQKHRTSLKETSVLSRQNIGTLLQRSPMFSFSGKANFVSFSERRCAICFP